MERVRLGWVPNYFSHHKDFMDFSGQYTFTKTKWTNYKYDASYSNIVNAKRVYINVNENWSVVDIT